MRHLCVSVQSDLGSLLPPRILSLLWKGVQSGVAGVWVWGVPGGLCSSAPEAQCGLLTVFLSLSVRCFSILISFLSLPFPALASLAISVCL